MNITISISDKDRSRIEKEVERKVSLSLLRNIKREAPVDTGRLRSSYEYFEEGDNIGVRSDAPHASIMEYGSVPFTPPLAPLKEWGSRVFGDPKVGAAVWGKIRKEGVSPQPHVRPAIDELKARNR